MFISTKIVKICLYFEFYAPINIPLAPMNISLVPNGHVACCFHFQHVPDVPVQQLQPRHLLTVQLRREIHSQVRLLKRHVQGVASSEGNQCILMTYLLASL